MTTLQRYRKLLLLIHDAQLSLSTPLLTLSSIQCQAYTIDLHSCLHDFWNFSAFVNIFSETSLEKLSQLNGLLNNGNQGGNLRHVRKHQSHPAVPLRWLARTFFFWPVRSRQFKSFWNWFCKSKCPGAHLVLTVNLNHKHSIIPTSWPCVSEDVAAFT